MPESPYHLTVRVVLNPAIPAEAGDSGKYRWDRILLVVGLAAVSLGLLVWLTRSPEPASRPVVAVAPDATGGLAASRPEAAPETATRTPAEAAAQAPADDPSRPQPEGASALPSEGVAQAAPEPVIELPQQDLPGQRPAEPASAPGAEPVVEAAPAVAEVPASSPVQEPAAAPPATSQAATGSTLRSPPVTGGSTRIISGDVRRFLITDRVEAREPVGDISDIREDRKVEGLVKVIAYSDVAGRAGDFLEYRWIRDDQLVAKVPVGVGSDSWRSYTSKFLNKDMRGDWRVELRTRGGELLAETAFEY